MGADFLEKKAKRYMKLWDMAAVKLRTPDLLTREPECAERNSLAALAPNAKTAVGQHLLIRLLDNDVVALNGHDEVARFIEPPDALIDALRSCHGVAPGTVTEMHSESGVVSIRIGRE
jgi:hypothetical protein